MNPRTVIACLSLPLIAACESLAPASRPSTPEAAGISATRMQSVSHDLADFVPAIEPSYVGGECQVRDAPAIPPGRNPPGSRLVRVYFPTRRSPRNDATVTINPEGEIIRYGETWGTPRSSNPDFEEAMKEVARIRRSNIVLDFVTGEATASTVGGDGPDQLIRGTVAEFERTPVIAEMRERASTILLTCLDPEH